MKSRVMTLRDILAKRKELEEMQEEIKKFREQNAEMIRKVDQGIAKLEKVHDTLNVVQTAQAR